MTTPAETLAPHFAAIAHQLGRIADALEGGSTSHSPKKAPVAESSPSRASVDPPAAYDAPNGLKEHLDAQNPWRDIREALAEHRYRGASQSVCTCGWTHAGRVDPVGEWLDHVTDVILAELGLS